jgi:hypothetical protein
MSIITVDIYKEYNGIKNPESDSKLAFIVDYVNQFIELYCNTKFTPTVVTGYKTHTTTGEVILPNVPIISVEAVNTIAGTPIEDFYVDNDLGIITINSLGVLVPRAPNVSIDYTYGYEQVPVGLIVPAVEFVSHLFKREFVKSKNNSLGESVTFIDPNVVPVQVRAGLDLYRFL